MRRSEALLAPAEDICGLIQPTGYKILVYIPPRPATRKGGMIAEPEDRRSAEENASVWAQVIAFGPEAYKDEKRFPNGAWCKKGDFVMMRSYSGTRFERAGYPYQYRLINDDTVEAVISGDPEEIERSSR